MRRMTCFTLVRRTVLGLAFLSFALTSGARAGNIVIDPGFEQADPGAVAPPGGTSDYFNQGTSIDGGFWNVTAGSVSVDTDSFYDFAGNKSVGLDGASGPNSLTQSLSTVAGQLYTISFWANADGPNSFSVLFGGSSVTGLPSSITANGFPSGTYLGNSAEFMLYTATAFATSNSTALTFTATLPAGTTTVEIDNVSVVAAAAVPEPSALVLAMVGGIGGLAVVLRRRRR